MQQVSRRGNHQRSDRWTGTECTGNLSRPLRSHNCITNTREQGIAAQRICLVLWCLRVGLAPTRPEWSRRAPGPTLQVAGLLPADRPDALDKISGANCIVIQLPLPRSFPGGPAETMTFEGGPGVIVRFSIKQDLQAIDLCVGLHPAAIKLPAYIAGFALLGQRFNSGFDAADFSVIVTTAKSGKGGLGSANCPPYPLSTLRLPPV